jgi:hypothetical protein
MPILFILWRRRNNMPIYIGTSIKNQKEIIWNGKQMCKVYVGSNLVWQKIALAVGDSYQGGIIGYIFQEGDNGYVAGEVHGIIAAVSDQSDGIQWHNGTYYQIGGGFSQELYDGAANTSLIINSQGAGSYAAQICADLTEGGYSDWFLPTVVEMDKFYENRVLIGNFAEEDYWTSYESGKDFAAKKNFADGSGLGSVKGNLHRVRAARYF